MYYVELSNKFILNFNKLLFNFSNNNIPFTKANEILRC